MSESMDDGPTPDAAASDDPIAGSPRDDGPRDLSARRVFLVVADDSPEMIVALRFACLRARNTGGRVALLTVVQPPDFQHWMSVQSMIESEQREAAERTLQKLAGHVNEWAGDMPILYLQEGQWRETLLQLIAEEPEISILVLAAASGPSGPGPLISALTGKYMTQLRVPVTIVPGTLSDEDLEAIA